MTTGSARERNLPATMALPNKSISFYIHGQALLPVLMLSAQLLCLLLLPVTASPVFSGLQTFHIRTA